MEQKRGEGKQRFLKGGKLGQGEGAIKRGAETPLQTMVLLGQFAAAHQHIMTDWEQLPPAYYQLGSS